MEDAMTTTRESRRPYRIEFLYRPGRNWSDRRLAGLVRELRDTAATCFDELPNYQVMTGTREELSDKVLAVAWRKDGRMAGFCATVVLPVADVGKVLHLGLTCVRPEDRGNGLTHMLTRKAVAGYLMRRKPVGRLWVSNCAAVLSSLGNVALHFDHVFPAPGEKSRPTLTHQRIAAAISLHYRHKMFVPASSRFDPETFVFKGSIQNTVFAKEGGDQQFHHRLDDLNAFYLNLLDFDAGDEVLQIGCASTIGAMKHLYKKRVRRPTAVQQRRQLQPAIAFDDDAYDDLMMPLPVAATASAQLPQYPYR
jgi:hypothetical protein